MIHGSITESYLQVKGKKELNKINITSPLPATETTVESFFGPISWEDYGEDVMTCSGASH